MNEPLVSGLLSAAIATFVDLIFVRAAWHKLAAFTEFTGFLADYRLLDQRLVVPASAALAAAEAGVVVLLLAPGGQPFGLGLGIGLLGLYAIAMSINIARGRTAIECGCGGAVQPLSWSLVTRNGVLAVIAAVGVLASVGVPLDVGGTLAAIASGFMFWLVFLLVEQILANTSTARLTR